VISSQKRLIRALKGEVLERPPIWLMRQAGRYLPEYHVTRAQAGGMLGLCNTPELAAEVTLQPLRRFDLDAAILFADLPQIANALGQDLAYHEGEGPVLSPPIRSSADMARLSIAPLHERMAPIYQTVRVLKQKLPEATALIGFAGAPWTVATYMVEGCGGSASGFAHVKRWAFADPVGFQVLIDLLTDAIGQYLEKQIAAGCEAVQLFDSWASVLPQPFFDLWCAEPVRKITAKLKAAHPDVPVIAFPRGAGLLYSGYHTATGVDAIGLDETVPLDWARLQAKTAPVQGNLDPQVLVVGGDAMAREATRILRGLADVPHVFNLGHGISLHTPPAHVEALVNQVTRWQR
jgi:uroporphyrinogen decarboxylase